MFFGETKLPGRPTYSDGMTLAERAANAPSIFNADTRAAWGELWAASREAQIVIDNGNASLVATERAYDARIKAIHEATGVRLDNPRKVFGRMPQTLAEQADYELDPVGWQTRAVEAAESAFASRLAELRKQFPDHAETIAADRPIADDVTRLVREADARLQAASQSGDLTAEQRLFAAIGGGMAGGLRDPIQLLMLPLGGGPGAGRTALARIGQVMLTEAAVNAGVETLLQTQAQAWRKQNGLQASLGDALANVGIAALFGGGIGGGIQGGRELARALKIGDPAAVEAIQAVASGNATRADFETAAAALDVDFDELDARIFDAANDAIADDAAAWADPPDLVPADERERLMTETLQRANDGDLTPPPGAPALPPRDPDVDYLFGDAPDAVRPGFVTVDGKPIDLGDAMHVRAYELGQRLREINADIADLADRISDGDNIPIRFGDAKDEVFDLYPQFEGWLYRGDRPVNPGEFGRRAIMYAADVDDEARRFNSRAASYSLVDPEFEAEWLRRHARNSAAPAPEAAARAFTKLGRTVSAEQVDPRAVLTDAQAYQYKGNADAEGVTERLRDVREWDPTASGKVFVHERLDGKRYIADGHQRLGLAKRLQAEGQDVALDAFVFREKDGWTIADLRALAAKKNMQEGSGTALDAARVLRDRPDLLDDAMPISGDMMKRAVALSRLSPDAFGLVINGLANEIQGATVGRLAPDPATHAAILADVIKLNPNERMADLLVREILATTIRHETQSDMFGAMAVARTLTAERVKVLDAALQALKRDKRLFGAVADNADLLAAAGNVLDTQTNAATATAAETLAALIDRLARARGPVSGLLTQAAERFADGSTIERESRRFIADMRALVDERGVGALLRDEPEPVLKGPQVEPEPATPDGEAAAQAALFPETPETPVRTVATDDPTTLFPEPVKPIEDPSLPEFVYHGTSSGGFKVFDTYGGKYGLMGQGAYFTESPKMATEYLDKGKGVSPTLYQARIAINNPLNMEAPANRAAWLDAFADYLDPEDIPDGATNEAAYRALESNLELDYIPDYEGAEIIQDGLKAMGHDGITHIGGGRHAKSKGVNHRVWIAFDPEQIDVVQAVRGEKLDDQWRLIPDGEDGAGKARYTDHDAELAKGDALDAAADLVEACKD